MTLHAHRRGVLLAGMASAGACVLVGSSASAAVLQYGDKDMLGTGVYPIDPVTGATLEGLAPGSFTMGAPAVGHGFPFDPAPGDYAGTDRIYTSTSQSGFSDGYSSYGNRGRGHTIVMDYSSLLGPGESVASLTLGVGFDDFQAPVWGPQYTLSINGVPYAPLSALANSLNQTGPLVQFASIGIDPALLLPTHILTLTIDLAAPATEGWAVDFLTIGVTVPAPGAAGVLALGAIIAGRRRRSV